MLIKQVWLWPQKAPGMCDQEILVILVNLLLFLMRLALSLTTCLFNFCWGSFYILCTFVHSWIIENPLFCHNFLICIHRQTHRRTNTRLEYIYWVYSRRSTTFVFICSPNSWFLRIFDIFPETDRQTDQLTDRPTYKGIEALILELKKSKSGEGWRRCPPPTNQNHIIDLLFITLLKVQVKYQT